MTDKPILFSAPMIRALLDGRKSMTRRVLKPIKGTTFADLQRGPEHSSGIGFWATPPREKLGEPRYAVGDQLWVREAWQGLVEHDALKPSDIWPGSDIIYNADRPDAPWLSRKRPGMFMPRWASRLTLTVTDVRVQRLQDISEQDAIAEGVCQMAEDSDHPVMWEGLSRKDRTGLTVATYGSNRKAFQHLWESINGPSAWEANPWVAAVSFDVHRCNIDAMHDPSPERSTP